VNRSVVGVRGGEGNERSPIHKMWVCKCNLV